MEGKLYGKGVPFVELGLVASSELNELHAAMQSSLSLGSLSIFQIKLRSYSAGFLESHECVIK